MSLTYHNRALLNKEVQILMDESINSYRLVRKDINDETTDEDMTASQISVDLDEHRLISKSIYHAGNSVKMPVRPAKVPRPPNCFILYRQANHHLVKNANPGVSNNEICEYLCMSLLDLKLILRSARILGARWNNETPAVREQYTRLADDLKREHAIKHPDYQYAPRRPSERKRRTPRVSTHDMSFLRDDPNFQQILSQAQAAPDDDHFLPVDDKFMQMLNDKGMFYGPNGVEPLQDNFGQAERQQIANDLASGSSLATLNYLPDFDVMLNADTDNHESLLPGMF